MKSILIISFHFPPFDGIASYRTNAYAQFLPDHGIQPTIITHNWIKKNNQWDIGDFEFEKNNGGTQIFKLGRTKHDRNDSDQKGGIYNKFQLFRNWLIGDLDADKDLKRSYISFKTFIFDYLVNNSPDLILGIYSPNFPLKLAYQASLKFNIPYILDFRDLWDNRELSNVSIKNNGRLIANRLSEFYWRKWSKSALFFLTTGAEWRDYLQDKLSIDGYVVENGFEENLIKIRNEIKQSQENFIISYVGNLYNDQNIETFLKAYLKFWKSSNSANTKMKFIGISKLYGNLSLQRISQILPIESYEVVGRVSKDQSMKYICESNILWFPCFEDYSGWRSAKLYDYIGSGRFILISKGDNGTVDRLIRDTNSGLTANTQEEIMKILEVKYGSWKEKKVPYSCDFDLIDQYSRKNQVRIFAEIIKQLN